jgi:hypothetical protein
MPRVEKALADLPWVDKKFEIKGKQVRITITDKEKYNPKQITARLEKEFGDATILK